MILNSWSRSRRYPENGNFLTKMDNLYPEYPETGFRILKKPMSMPPSLKYNWFVPFLYPLEQDIENKRCGIPKTCPENYTHPLSRKELPADCPELEISEKSWNRIENGRTLTRDKARWCSYRSNLKTILVTWCFNFLWQKISSINLPTIPYKLRWM